MAALARSYFGPQDTTGRNFEQIIGDSPALKSVLEQVELVARTDSAVLILGETAPYALAID